MKAVSCTPPLGRFRHLPEPVEIVARGLGKLEEFRQQVFCTGKCDVQVARFQEYPRRHVGQLPTEYIGFYGDLHASRCLIPAELTDGMVQPFFAPTFLLKFFPASKSPQLLDQQIPIDEKGPAGLIAAETVQQFDRLPPP
jgi:hypothetical protein